MEIIKTVRINILEPTKIKSNMIDNLISTYKSALEYVVEREKKSMSRYSLHEQLYQDVREKYGLNSQTVVELFKDAVAILNNGGSAGSVTVPFNIPRSGKFAITESGNPVISFAGMDGRIVVPVAMDGAYDRFISMMDEGYDTTFFRISKDSIFVTFKKEFNIPDDYDAIVGVDVGVERLAAVSIIDRDGKILRQLYFGQDVGHKKRDIGIRRSKLKGYADKGSRYAKCALRKLKRYETNYTQTRCYQVAHKIVELAKQYNAFISIENLKHLNKAKGHRKSNRKTKRMPYSTFRVALESVAGQNNILVRAVDPAYTSQICSRCGTKGTRNGAVFKCAECGYQANSDRNASVNIAIRAGINFHISNKKFFYNQTPDGNLSVNTGVSVHDGMDVRCLQHLNQSPRQAPSS